MNRQFRRPWRGVCRHAGTLAIALLSLCAWTFAESGVMAQGEPYYVSGVLDAASAGGLNSPQGIALDSAGNLFVADTGNWRIVEFDGAGSLIRAFGSHGRNPGQFENPVAVAIDSAGEVCVGDAGSSAVIEVFRADGTFLRQFTVPAITDLTAAPDGSLYALEGYTIAHLDTRGNVLASATLPDGAADGDQYTYTGLALAPSGRILLANVLTNSNPEHPISNPGVTVLAADLSVVTNNTLVGLAEPPSATARIATDTAGDIYLSVYLVPSPYIYSGTPGVVTLDPTGQFLLNFSSEGVVAGGSDSPVTMPTGLAVDADGSVFAANGSAGASYVVAYTPSDHPRFDLVWQDAVSNAVVYWNMRGPLHRGGGYLAQGVDADWKVVCYVDLFSEGAPGLLWQSQSTGDVVYWRLANHQETSGELLVSDVTPDWRLVAAADLNGDGIPDFIWQNRSTGDVVYWLLGPPPPSGGLQVLSAGYLAQGVQTNFRLVGLADLDNNGAPDMIWQDKQTGDVVYWLLSPDFAGGFTVSATGYLAQGLAAGWQVVALEDVNGDGEPDLIWQNSQTGDVAYWLLYGPAANGSGEVAQGVGSNWTIVAAN